MTPKAFTLIEIMIVVIILGVLASIGLSGYGRVVERGYCRNAQTRLVLIKQAIEVYIAKRRANPPDAGSLATIATTLNINIPPDPNFDYSLSSMSTTATRNGGPSYSCTLNNSNALTSTNPSCTDSTFCESMLPP